jgi:hypothetical protein
VVERLADCPNGESAEGVLTRLISRELCGYSLDK